MLFYTRSECYGMSGGEKDGVFTVMEITKNGIPIASISKLVLACIICYYSERDGKDYTKYELKIGENRSVSVDEVLHMKSGIVFSIDENDYESVMKMVNVLENYREIRHPTTYSNVNMMFLAYNLENIIGDKYEDALRVFCEGLGLKNTYSCSIEWKIGSGDIVTTEDDIIKIGEYVRDNFEWFADDMNGETYRGRGIDVVSSDANGRFVIKDGAQYVKIDKNDLMGDSVVINGKCIKTVNDSVKCINRLFIHENNGVKHERSINKPILPFTNEYIPWHRTERVEFEDDMICVDYHGNSIKSGTEVEIIQKESYNVFGVEDFHDREEIPDEWENVSEIELIGKFKGVFPCVCKKLSKNILECRYELMLGGKTITFTPVFVIDNGNYIISPFEYCEYPYAKIENGRLYQWIC